jgi:transcriptional regulator with XRE-family HTH domain
MKHPFDVHVGAKLRQCRLSARMSRQELGARIGVDASKIRDFEEGEGRIESSLLRSVVAVTGVSPAFFFEGLACALGDAA